MYVPLRKHDSGHLVSMSVSCSVSVWQIVDTSRNGDSATCMYIHVYNYVLYRCNTTDMVVSTCTVRAHVHVYLCVFGFGDQVHIIHFCTLMADHRHYNTVHTMYTIRVTMKPPK